MNEVFRTYLKGDGKSPNVPKGTKLKNVKSVLSLEEAEQHHSYGGLLNSGYIDISFDTDEISQKFWDMAEQNGWKCLIQENPSNGHIHSFWKIPKKWDHKDGHDKQVAVGLIADIHSKDTYIPIRVDGVNREFIYEPDTVQEVPEELYPVKTNINLLELSEGDGRNEELFKYILVLQGQLGLSQDIMKRILDNTNHHVFKTPVPESEFETITRDEAFSAPVFYEGRTFLHNAFALYMKSQFHIIRINGQLHVYDDGIYKSGYKMIESKMIQVLPQLKASYRTEVLKFLEISIPEDTEVSDARYIVFKNCIYDITTGMIQDFTPDIISTNMIPWNYNEDAYSELADVTLDKISCHDDEIRSLLEECIGYCFFRQNELSKSFMLTGTGANGKSTFLDMVKHTLGRNNFVSLDMDELSERFSTASMFGKLANIGDDISDDFLQGKQLSQFKKLVSGNDVKGENKGQDVFFFKPYTKLLFSANEIPRMRNRGFEAIKRRLVIIPFNAKFSKDDPDYDSGITWKLKTQEVAEYLIQLGLAGLTDVLKNQNFTESQKVVDSVNNFEKENNPILLFLEEVEEQEIINHETKEVFRRYDYFCNQNGFQRIAMQTFTKEIKKYLHCDRKDTRVNGQKKIIFVKG